MNRRIYETVARKRASEGPLEPAEAAVEQQISSKGWNTGGYLPHCDKPGTLQMVTFRLADAMPAARRQEWEVLFQIKDEREKRTRLEAYLDLGCGECLLRKPRAAEAVEGVIQRFDGRRYRLAAWVVMPNHFHALVELWTITLGQLLKAWKGVSAYAVNGVLGRSGQLWQEDYWDRYIRDEEHFGKARRYIESNPAKAGLAQEAAAWPWSSANPKWRWSSPNRLHNGHLLHADGERLPEWSAARSADILVRQSSLAGAGGQGGTNAAGWEGADKNVRAPKRSRE